MVATQLMYETEFKKKMVYLHLNEGRTIASLSAEYGFAKSTYREWKKKYCEECQKNEEAKEELNLMEQNQMLKKQLSEQQQEIEFLKKAGHSLQRKSISFISVH